MSLANFRIGVLLSLAVLGSVVSKALSQDAAPQPTGLQMAMAMEQALEAAIAKAEKSVVAIARVSRTEPRDNLFNDARLAPFGPGQGLQPHAEPTSPDYIPSEFGTGVIVDRTGLILTNFHILEDESDYYVTTSERKVYQARVRAADPRGDLAVLSIDARELTPITFGNGAAVKKGQIVIALGNPYAIARDGQASASWGIVANMQRKAGRTTDESTPSGKPTLHHLGTLIQTDAKLNLGTSGGALVNLQGEMVGLTTSLAAAAGYEQSAGYAIPVDETFRRAVDSLKQGQEVEYGFLGVQPGELFPNEVLDGKHGARVQDVKWGTPAHLYGLKQSDVITHVNGEAIHDADGLVLRVGSQPSDATVKLTVERDGRTVPVNVTLAKYHVTGNKVVTQKAPAWRGLRVDHWTAKVEFRNDLPAAIDLNGCVLVTDVEAGSPADRASLKTDMSITHVDGVRISTPKEFAAAVAGKTGAVTLRLSQPSDGGPTERDIEAE